MTISKCQPQDDRNVEFVKDFKCSMNKGQTLWGKKKWNHRNSSQEIQATSKEASGNFRTEEKKMEI
jgi:hypothetical protein